MYKIIGTQCLSSKSAYMYTFKTPPDLSELNFLFSHSKFYISVPNIEIAFKSLFL